MKSDKLQNAIGGIDYDLIIRSEAPIGRKKRYSLISAIAAVLVLAIGIGIFAGNPGYTVYAGDMIAVYPTMAPFPERPYDSEAYAAWNADQKTRERYFGQGKHMEYFIRATVGEILLGDGENLVYSPVNLYLALAMLAESSEGNTRRQLLDLLGTSNIKTLRRRANAIWNANYNDDGATSSILASSLWLNEAYSYHKETLEILRDSYYASSYQGIMGSEAFEEALRTWLNEQTGGLLSDEIDSVSLSPETVMAIATTVYFRAKWASEFSEGNTQEAVFHGTGGDTSVEFMNQKYDSYFCRGNQFSAVSKKLDGSGNVWFVLPDEGVCVNDLLKDGNALSFLSATDDSKRKTEATIHLSVPKFSVTSKFDLKESLENLGVTDCFDEDRADFSALVSGEDPVYVGKVEHSVSVDIDESGFQGAAYTVLATYGGGYERPDKEVFFTADRPFLFVITGEDGTVVFIGVVQQL